MKKTLHIGSTGLLLASALVAGCAVGPDFKPPAAPATDRYTAHPFAPMLAADGAAPQAMASGRDIPAEWWSLFHSSALDALVRQALSANADLEAARASLRAAQDNALAQRGTLFPTIGLEANPTRQQVAPVLSSPLESGGDLYSLHTVQLNIAYAPDVFGGTRRQIESVQAQAEAARFELEAAQLSLTANLVSAVVQRAAVEAQIEATRAIVGLATAQLKLVRRQHELGDVGAPDVAAQEALLAQFEATLPPLAKQAAQLRNQLAVLLGRLPSDAEIPAIGLAELHLPAELPLSLPSQLVAQRPDVRAAEAQWHAANAQIGVAVAARLPSLQLSATSGSSALKFSQLFGAGTGFWSLGADLAQPLFDAGTLRQRQRAAEDTQVQAAAQYRSTVLGAFQNVADTLNALEADTAALGAQQRAEQAAEHSLRFARAQREAGATGSAAVLIAQLGWQQATLARVQAQAARLQDSAALMQALGGGWWNRVDDATGAAGPGERTADATRPPVR